MPYTIFSRESMVQLIQDVQAVESDGWFPVGGVSFIPCGEYNNDTWLQALRKTSEQGESPTTAGNTGSLKLPTLEECEKAVVNSDNDRIQILLDRALVKRCYDFICRQLQASA